MVNTPNDWILLQDLRELFLKGSSKNEDYWLDNHLMTLYDSSFAQRISWKWKYVWDELGKLGWKLPNGACLDWACGTGIASRTAINIFGEKGFTEIQLFDRSSRVMDFATSKIKEIAPNLNVSFERKFEENLVLISHVLNELTESELQNLINQLTTATAIIWVDAGTKEVSKKLIEIRENLKKSFNIIAPCFHQKTCGMLLETNQRHWCHHFADSPPEAYRTREWSEFASLMKIDLRNLPLSYLVLDKRTVGHYQEGITRLIGKPRVLKGSMLYLGCRSEGIVEGTLSKRTAPDAFKLIKKGKFGTKLDSALLEEKKPD